MQKEIIEIESTPAKKGFNWKILVIVLIVLLILAIFVVLSFTVYDYIAAPKNETNVTATNVTQNDTPINPQINNTLTNLTNTTNPDDTPDDTNPCTPNCANKQCGGDGCGGTCGTCTSGICNSTGNCAQLMNCTIDANCSYLTGICGIGLCNQTSKQCYASYNLSSTTCRNNVSECDAAEMCTGNSVSCPNDANKSDGTACFGGTCNSGDCIESHAIYIDKNLASNCLGNYSIANRNCLGSDGDAYKNFSGAISAVQPGDTVLIRGGTYSETLRPVNSGIAGNPITFKSYNGEKVLVTGVPAITNIPPGEWPEVEGEHYYGIYIFNKSNLVIEGLNFDNINGWARIIYSSNISLTGNNFTRATSGGPKGSVRFYYGSGNKIINNTIYSGNDNLEIVNSDRNLIEGNNITSGRHTLWTIKCGNYNVIRGNYFNNPLEKIGEIFDCDEDAETDVYYWFGIILHNATKHNLVENNIFAYTPKSYWGLQYAGQNGIIRNNLFYNSLMGGLGMTSYCGEAEYNEHTRIYNNVFYNNSEGGIYYRYSGCRDPPNEVPQWSDSVSKNNILYNNLVAQLLVTGWCDVNCPRMRGFYFENNNIFNSSVGDKVLIYSSNEMVFNDSLLEVTSSYPSLFIGNIEVNPSFVNANSHDFHLQSGSQMIDAGAFLTNTTSAGSGIVMQVSDAGYFYDGYGIQGELGDLIQLEGQTTTARILSIDYATNTLILDKSLSWTSGQRVSLAYSGSKPDIGAYEYSGGIGGASIQSETLPSEKSSLSFASQIYNFFKGFLTGNTIKEITGYFLKIR